MRRAAGTYSIGPMPPRFVTFLLNGCEDVSLITFEQIPDGGLVEVEADIDGAVESLIVHRQGDAVRAWLNVCPHAGRRRDYAPGQFLKSKEGQLVCAVHGASFELAAGECTAGPCRGDRLRDIPVKVEGGQVLLATP